MLTKKQSQLLVFIHGHIKENGYSPSYKDMQVALKLASRSGIHRHLIALVERGFIRKIPNRARALEVVKLPISATISAPPKGRQEFRPSIVGSNKNEVSQEITLPVFGRIGENSSISVIERSIYKLKLPDGLNEAEEYFGSEIAGQWMSGIGIYDGDMVIFMRTDTYRNGDLVCAIVDNKFVSIKRYRRFGHSIALEGTSENQATQIYKKTRIELQGKVVLLQRRYGS